MSEGPAQRSSLHRILSLSMMATMRWRLIHHFSCMHEKSLTYPMPLSLGSLKEFHLCSRWNARGPQCGLHSCWRWVLTRLKLCTWRKRLLKMTLSLRSEKVSRRPSHLPRSPSKVANSLFSTHYKLLNLPIWIHTTTELRLCRSKWIVIGWPTPQLKFSSSQSLTNFVGDPSRAPFSFKTLSRPTTSNTSSPGFPLSWRRKTSSTISLPMSSRLRMIGKA